MFNAQPDQQDRSLGELFGDLSREITTLVRQEMNLARTEMSQKLSRLGKDVGFMAAGGLVAYAGLLTLIAALVIILHEVGLALWASALLVGLVVAGVGGFLLVRGLNALKQEDLTPHETIASLKEDVHGANTARRRAA